MTDRPIMFSAPMVRAILGGHKTQTRRLASSPLRRVKEGDRLWVRETYVIESNMRADGLPYNPPFSDCRPIRWVDCPEYGRYWEQCHYRASDPAPDLCYEDVDDPCCRWRPSIYMPRWASRIMLEAVWARVEPLQAIGEGDAVAEGSRIPCDELTGEARQASWSERQTYSRIWDGLHKAPGTRWEDNPDVVAVAFRRSS